MLVISTFLTPPPQVTITPWDLRGDRPPSPSQGGRRPWPNLSWEVKNSKKNCGRLRPFLTPPPAAVGDFAPPSTVFKVWGINDCLQGVGGND